MKVIPFQVPQTKKEAFRVQVDRLPHFYDKLHQHHEVQIMLIEKGEGTLIAGDYVGRFKPGEIYIIGSKQAHVFRSDDQQMTPSHETRAASLSIMFDEKYLGEHFWQLDEMEPARQLLQKAERGMKIRGKALEQICNLMLSVANQADIDRMITFFTIIKVLSDTNDYDLLSVSTPQESNGHGEGKRMNDILQLTFGESHRKIYIDEVAKVANLSTEAFCRYFKMRTGKTYTNFLNEVRVSNACKLLINKDLSVQDVCYESGFSNLSNFNRIFKKVTGKTPSRYLQS